MAQQEFDPYALLETLRAGGDVDLIRTSVELVLQALIEAEATGVIGAAPHERSDERTNYRNGHRPRLLSTKAGDIELKIPKLHAMRFRRRYPAWGKYGVSAFAAHDEVEVDVICETKLERFEEVVVFERSELERIGIEVVPTFRRPHVTLAHEDLNVLVDRLQSCEHRTVSNRHHQREGRQP